MKGSLPTHFGRSGRSNRSSRSGQCGRGGPNLTPATPAKISRAHARDEAVELSVKHGLFGRRRDAPYRAGVEAHVRSERRTDPNHRPKTTGSPWSLNRGNTRGRAAGLMRDGRNVR